MNGVDGAGDNVIVRVESSPNGEQSATATQHPPRNADVPKPKRLACMICRKRKLRCDGNRPRCSTCTRLGHDCAYDEVRRKSGPKRGYVKALEERLSASTTSSRPRAYISLTCQPLEQVETLLKNQEPPAASKTVANDSPQITISPHPENNENNENTSLPQPSMVEVNVADAFSANKGDLDRWNLTADNSPRPPAPPDSFDFSAIPIPNNFTWEMIGLGLEEPLPPQESIDEL